MENSKIQNNALRKIRIDPSNGSVWKIEDSSRTFFLPLNYDAALPRRLTPKLPNIYQKFLPIHFPKLVLHQKKRKYRFMTMNRSRSGPHFPAQLSSQSPSSQPKALSEEALLKIKYYSNLQKPIEICAYNAPREIRLDRKKLEFEVIQSKTTDFSDESQLSCTTNCPSPSSRTNKIQLSLKPCRLKKFPLSSQELFAKGPTPQRRIQLAHSDNYIKTSAFLNITARFPC